MEYVISNTENKVEDTILAKKFEHTTRNVKYFLAYKSCCVRAAHYENLKQEPCYGYRPKPFDEETGEDTIVYTVVSYDLYRSFEPGDDVVRTGTYVEKISKKEKP